jgi:hypothetical protein
MIPSPRHGDDVVFKVFEALINTVHRWRFHDSTEPFCGIELRAVWRKRQHTDVGMNPKTAFEEDRLVREG